jgi:hypothetical protein
LAKRDRHGHKRFVENISVLVAKEMQAEVAAELEFAFTNPCCGSAVACCTELQCCRAAVMPRCSAAVMQSYRPANAAMLP